MFDHLKEIYAFREVLINFVVQELKVRYRKSILGFLWSLLNPLLTMIVTSIVFSHIMRFDLNDFVIFVFSGLLPWGFISASIEGGTMSLINAEGFIKKIYLPKMIFPLAIVTSNFINMIFSMIALFIIIMFLGVKITTALFFLPVAFLLVYLAVTGLCLTISTATVFFRDIRHISGVITSIMFYLTPIIYPAQYIPEKYAAFIYFNPFYYIVELFRAPIYQGHLPDMNIIIIAGVFSVAVFLLGLKIIVANERNIVFRL